MNKLNVIASCPLKRQRNLALISAPEESNTVEVWHMSHLRDGGLCGGRRKSGSTNNMISILMNFTDDEPFHSVNGCLILFSLVEGNQRICTIIGRYSLLISFLTPNQSNQIIHLPPPSLLSPAFDGMYHLLGLITHLYIPSAWFLMNSTSWFTTTPKPTWLSRLTPIPFRKVT